MSWIVCIFKGTNPVDGSYPDLLLRLFIGASVHSGVVHDSKEELGQWVV